MNRLVNYNSKRRGFTIAEVIIAMAIVIVLAGISVPLFASALRNYQLKRVNDQETAAKTAAVIAFYTGYDSKGNPVNITENGSGVCTFLYDEANDAVYVINSDCGVNGFLPDYSSTIEKYGISVTNGENYSESVIIVVFDGRYHSTQPKNLDPDPDKNGSESRGACEEPIIRVYWKEPNSDLFA